jgi:hypothetical protein
VSRFDRGTSFALVDRSLRAGCSLDRPVARALARGALWASAPATDEGSARAETEALARLATSCPGRDEDARAFQEQPERTLVDPAEGSFDRGAALFFEWLDATFAAEPGALLGGLWALAPTMTATTATHWSGTPTGFDVLGVSLKGALGESSTFEDVLVRFAATRALMTPPARLAWDVPWPEKARRFASPVPVSPTGASYVRVDLAGARPGAGLRVEATWEDYSRMRWAVLELDSQGREKRLVPITSLPRGTSAAMTVEPLDDGVSRLVIVGVNVGTTEHPFDPNQGVWEAHGWLLTIEGR